MVSTGIWILSLALALIGLCYFVSDDLLFAGLFWIAANFTGLIALLPSATKSDDDI